MELLAWIAPLKRQTSGRQHGDRKQPRSKRPILKSRASRTPTAV